jgi:hypothetical protein
MTTGSAPLAPARTALAGWPLVGWAALAIGLGCAAGLLVASDTEAGVRLGLRITARTSFAFFLLAFSASSLRRLWRSPTTAWLLRNRRYLGVSFAASHAYHLAFILWLRSIDPEPLAISTSIGGGGAFVWIALMAATSSDRAFAWLGARRWRLLHRTGSWWIWFVFTVSYVPRAFESIAYVPVALATLAAAGLRAYAHVRSRRHPSPATSAR